MALTFDSKFDDYNILVGTLVQPSGRYGTKLVSIEFGKNRLKLDPAVARRVAKHMTAAANLVDPPKKKR